MTQRTVWLFDNDNTLYRVPKELETAITHRVITTLADTLKLSFREIEDMRRKLREKHKKLKLQVII